MFDGGERQSFAFITAFDVAFSNVTSPHHVLELFEFIEIRLQERPKRLMMAFLFEEIKLEDLSTFGIENDLTSMTHTDNDNAIAMVFEPVVEFRPHTDGVFALAAIVGLAFTARRLQVIKFVSKTPPAIMSLQKLDVVDR